MAALSPKRTLRATLEKVIEKREAGGGCKKTSKSSNIPWSTVKSITKKKKECGTAVNLPGAAVLKKRAKKIGEGGYQETSDNSGGVKSFGG